MSEDVGLPPPAASVCSPRPDEIPQASLISTRRLVITRAVDVNLTRRTFVADGDSQHPSQTMFRSYPLTDDQTVAVTIDQSIF